ncbi:MAG: hypothetical protein C4290_09635, partial [Chloroflexota bacterium]
MTFSSGSAKVVGGTPSVSMARSTSNCSRMCESCCWNFWISASVRPTRASWAMCRTSSRLSATARLHGKGSVREYNRATVVAALYRHGRRLLPSGTNQPRTPQPMAVDAQRAITLGHPSYVWRSGQERRLSLIRRYVPLEGRGILDIGCGLGTYVRRLRDFSPRVYGLDVDAPRVIEGTRRGTPNLAVAAAEHLPFKDGALDVVVLNEVIEHVGDDRAALREALRVLRP